MQNKKIKALLESYRTGLITADELVSLLETTVHKPTVTSDPPKTKQQD